MLPSCLRMRYSAEGTVVICTFNQLVKCNTRNMIAQYLWIFGSLIFLLLGTAHLKITFLGTKLHPKNESTIDEMKNTYPRLTKETTMWKAWIGFNASHSAGAIFFGALNIVLASQYFWIIQESVFMVFINLLFVLFFLFLAKAYWFKIPVIGVLISTICFIVSIFLMH